MSTVSGRMGNTFRLMTANLLHEKCDVSDFSRVLEEANPDVLVNQELGPSCAEVISAKYPHHDLRPALDDNGRGIATRFEAGFEEIDMPGRAGGSAVLDVEGTKVRLAGVHLLNAIDFPWWVSVRKRRGQLDGILEWVDRASLDPLLVVGDFNASPAWPAYQKMAGRLTDLVASRAEEEDLDTEATWGWRPGWPRMLRIDHVFGEGVRAITVRVQPIAGTDHAAVIVDLEIS